MLSVAKGYDTGYLTEAVAGGREGYYTGAVAAGEPAGLWYGQGAADLGLSGEVDEDLLRGIYGGLLDPRDPATHDPARWGDAATLAAGPRNYRSVDERYRDLLAAEPHAGPERRAELRVAAEAAGRENVLFWDATFSAPKSVSVAAVACERKAIQAREAGDLVTAAAWSTMQRAVEDAVMVGARASVDYLQEMAGYSRAGRNGIRFVDAHRWTVAQFLQHDSRDRDPQLHVHQAILAVVECADGQWRRLDGKSLLLWKLAAGAVGDRAMEAHLSQALGFSLVVRETEHGVAREIAGVSQEVMELFSKRTQAITPVIAQQVELFRDVNGRDPSPLELDEIAQKATLVTRAPKAHDGETSEQRMARWTAEAYQRKEGGLEAVAEEVVLCAQRFSGRVDTWSERDVVERARAALGQGEQTWTRPRAVKAVSDALPANLGLSGPQARELLDRLVDRVVAGEVQVTQVEPAAATLAQWRLANGASPYVRPGSVRFASRGQIAAERVLIAAATERGAAALTVAAANAVIERFAESGVELGADQLAALWGVLTSGARVEVISAPAGTGKSFLVGTIAETWQDTGRRVTGVATSERATQVLREEGVTARNVTAWLDAQTRLGQQRPLAGDEDVRLRAGDIVVLDEASMTTTQDLLAVQQQCRAADVKLLLVGDPHQLAAVGPGGALADLTSRGLRYELAEVRRFSAAWEGTASLGLRQGDPRALDAYAKHGRLLEGGTAEQAAERASRAFLADTLAGQQSLLLVGSNHHAVAVSAGIRDQLVRLGRVEERGQLLRDGTIAGVGDVVQARRNAWDLRGFDGNERAPVNRQTYRVTGHRMDGGLVVEPVGGGPSLQLPDSYVRAHLSLGYASTVHAAQGRTVDTAHAVIGSGMDAAGVYVALTRGRDGNTAWAVTTDVPTNGAPGEAQSVQTRTARDVVANAIRRDTDADPSGSATTQIEQEQAQAQSVARALERMSLEIAEVTAGRLGVILDQFAVDGRLSAEQRAALAADDGYGPLERLLRTAEIAGHDPAQVLTDAVTARELDTAEHPAKTLHHRLRTRLDLTPRISSFADLVPRGIEEQARAGLLARADAADERRLALGASIAAEAPPWLVQALGPVPKDAIAAAEWEHAAGWIAAYRELAEHTSDVDVLGSPPAAGLAEKHATWHAAHEAAALPEAGAEEAQISEGLLRVHVRAWERERNWAPRYVADELEATSKTARKASENATMWAARAEVTSDPVEAQRLRDEAVWARAEAEALTQKTGQLELADTARARWSVETAVTRDRADRARAELDRRGVSLDDPTEQVTAQDWLAADRAHQAAEDRVREIRDEAELLDEHNPTLPTLQDPGPHALEMVQPDIRELSVPDVTEFTDPEDRTAIPSAEKTREAVDRTRDAVVEFDRRDDEQRAHTNWDAEQNRSQELAHWVAADRQAREQAEASHSDRG